MPDDTRELFATMTERYRSGNLPWADELPPPEIVALCEALPPGRALDLGCGLARSCIYLAQRGWHCDGVDFVPQAIEQAKERVIAAGAADRVTLHVGSVLALDHLETPFDLAIDVGCLHAQPKEAIPVYVAQLRRLLRPGGTFVLFAHLRGEADANEQRWTTLRTLEDGFDDGFHLERIVRGTTTMSDATWASVWMWFQRVAA
ncbi:MAG: class I SAM-dependent methyltransferase [Thermoflexales bacterium]